MHLLQFRIIDHPALAKASWVDVGPGINILAPPTTRQAQALLRSLQALSPAYDCAQVDPFSALPLYRTGGTVTRRIIPAKRTTVIAIYAASPELVVDLAAIDPLYYEIDRIEVGRRRDYSRWMNFVELPASARWGEVAPILVPLLVERCSGPSRGEIAPLLDRIGAWRNTDRIKGEQAQWLLDRLESLQQQVPVSIGESLQPCIDAVALAEHFVAAKARVASRMPLFFHLPFAQDPTDKDVFSSLGQQLAFLAQRLREQMPDPAALSAKLAALNHQWLELGADYHLLRDVKTGQILVTLLPKKQREKRRGEDFISYIKTILQCTQGLHQLVMGCDPIFLLTMRLSRRQSEQCPTPLESLRRICSRFQCLVAPDQDFIELCRKPGRADLARSTRLRIVQL
nr:hypothetical protein [uncultured Desulfobulbus sp.]